MSHRNDCPSRWDAEREGERAQEYGRSRSANPYDGDIWGEGRCEEAADYWRSGYRRAEIREEEQREEEAMRQRAARHRAEMEAEEYDYAPQPYPEQPYPEEPFPDVAQEPEA